MKKKTNFIKKIIFSATLVLAIVCSSGIGLFRSLYSSLSTAFAYSNTSSLFSNSDFSSTSSQGTGQPLKPSNWTITADQNVNSGVISVKESDFKDVSYGLSENPSRDDSVTSDYKILMFRSETLGKAEAVSSEVTLSKNSFYKVSIFVKTMEGALGSITAKFGDKIVDFASISTSINNASYWRTYTYYVATDTLATATATLTLRFGSSASSEAKTTGSVFFDNIITTEIDENTFANAQEDSYTKKVSFLQRNTLTGITNGDFESDLTGWKRKDTSTKNHFESMSTEAITQTIQKEFDVETENIALTNAQNNTKSLLLLNNETDTKKIATTSENTFKIKQFGLYQITLLYKTGNLSGTGLNVKIYDKDYDSENSSSNDYYVEQTNLTGSDGLDNYNGFSLLSFCVKGDAQEDKEVLMEISLGEGTGWAIVDDIKMFPIVTSEYSSTNALDYTKNLSTAGSLSNEGFDLVTIEDQSQSDGGVYPATPSNWTFVGDNNGNKSGVIRLNSSVFATDSASYGSPTNPGFDKSYKTELSDNATNWNDNVLMIRNTSSDKVYYQSEKTTISANTASSTTYTRFTIGVKAVDGNKAFIRLVDSNNNVLGKFENITTDDAKNLTNGWAKYTIYVKNGVSSQNVSIQLGSYSGSDFVFFDNVILTKSISDEPTTLTGAKIVYVNLSTNGFANETGFSGQTKETTDYDFSYVKNITTRDEATDSCVLAINNVPKTYQTLVSDYTYSLSADSYYEFSVWVKTNFDTTNNSGDYGANIEIVSLDSDGNIVQNDENTNKFVNIVTNSTENNGWVKYSIYVYAESAQNVKVCLGAGTEENPVYGNAYFDDLTVKEINKEDYPAKADDTTILSTIVEQTTEEDDEDTTDDSSTTESAEINIWLLISSILLVIALILAIIGYWIRRIPKKKKEVKVDKETYNKEKDKVDESAIKKELKEQKAENLEKLNSEIEELQQQYNKLKQEYEEKTKNDEIVDQKLFASYTKKVNELLAKIDYLKSAITYLNDPINTKTMERREISKSKKELEKKNIELNLKTTVEDVQEEKVETKKKTKKRLQKFN